MKRLLAYITTFIIVLSFSSCNVINDITKTQKATEDMNEFYGTVHMKSGEIIKGVVTKHENSNPIVFTVETNNNTKHIFASSIEKVTDNKGKNVSLTKDVEVIDIDKNDANIEVIDIDDAQLENIFLESIKEKTKLTNVKSKLLGKKGKIEDGINQTFKLSKPSKAKTKSPNQIFELSTPSKAKFETSNQYYKSGFRFIFSGSFISEFDDMWAGDITATFGWQTRPKFFWGMGIGFNMDFWNENGLLPIFVEAKYDFVKNKPVTPFVRGRLGWSFIDNSSYAPYWEFVVGTSFYNKSRSFGYSIFIGMQGGQTKWRERYTDTESRTVSDWCSGGYSGYYYSYPCEHGRYSGHTYYYTETEEVTRYRYHYNYLPCFKAGMTFEFGKSRIE